MLDSAVHLQYTGFPGTLHFPDVEPQELAREEEMEERVGAIFMPHDAAWRPIARPSLRPAAG